MSIIKNPLAVVQGGGGKLGQYAQGTLAEITAKDLDGCTEILSEAFRGQENLLSVEIPSSVKIIGDSAFWSCESLSSIILNEGLEEIGDSAFYGCVTQNITIPSTVKAMGSNILYPPLNDSKMKIKTVRMLPVTPPTASGGAPFSQYKIEQIIVPVGSGNAYKSAYNWSKLADYIVEG